MTQKTKTLNTWQEIELGEICQINPKKSELKDMDGNTKITFLRMEDVVLILFGVTSKDGSKTSTLSHLLFKKPPSFLCLIKINLRAQGKEVGKNSLILLTTALDVFITGWS